MKRKVLIFGLCLLEVTCALSAKDKKSIPLYKDAKAPIEKRIDDLISRMTLEEKILQLNQYTLGRNNNVNNVGEEVNKVPSEIGSLIYFDINPELRNSMQKKAMEESNIRDKELILRVLAMYSDPEVREREIKNISSAYSVVAEQILPKLRRSKFVVNAERIGKSDEEIRNLAKSNPSALNVEELLYAATLFDNNGDKLAIYEAAMRQFPNDWRGFNDAGMILFETGKVAQAKADFEKANALSANNKTIKNNLGAVELINGNVKEAEVLFGAATGAGNEVNYNKGIVAIMKGDYKAAVDYFGKCNCVNAALANILAGNNNEAAKKLNEGKDDSALASYLKAVIAARNNDNSAVLSNLKTACSKDASMKKLAATDMEFAKLFDNADFQAIVK